MKPTDLRPVMTRIPEGLRRRLAKEAARSDRSMNAEIIHRLEQSFSAPDIARAVAEALPTRIIGLEHAFATAVERLVEQRMQQRLREEARAVEAEPRLPLPEPRVPEPV